MAGQMQPNVVMAPLPNQMQGPPGQQSRLQNQPFFHHPRPMRVPRHQTPNNPPMYSSPPSGQYLQFVGPQGAPPTFMPSGQGPPQYIPSHVRVNCFDFMFLTSIGIVQDKIGLVQYSCSGE